MSKRSKRKSAFRRHQNNHHIYCQSTHPELRNCKWNQVSIDVRLHSLYNQLFSNRSPEEIIVFLKEYFWGGRLQLKEESNGS